MAKGEFGVKVVDEDLAQGDVRIRRPFDEARLKSVPRLEHALLVA